MKILSKLNSAICTCWVGCIEMGGLIFCLWLGLISCKENRDTQLAELNKYHGFIETTSQKELSRVLKTLDRCRESGAMHQGLLKLKTTIPSLSKNSSRQLALIDSLRNKEELEAFKEREATSIQSLHLNEDLSNQYSQTLLALNLHSFPLEEARVVLKMNILLIEKEVRDQLLGKWAIDC